MVEETMSISETCDAEDSPIIYSKGPIKLDETLKFDKKNLKRLGTSDVVSVKMQNRDTM